MENKEKPKCRTCEGYTWCSKCQSITPHHKGHCYGDKCKESQEPAFVEIDNEGNDKPSQDPERTGLISLKKAEASELVGIDNQDLLEVYRTLFDGIPFLPFSVAQELCDRLEAAKETNKRLHRRTQEAESAIFEWQKISEFTKKQSTGRFYPALMRYALTKAHEENEQLQAKLKALKE